MLLYRRFLRALGVAALAGLAFAVGCKGHSSSGSTTTPSITVAGTVTYTRIPLAKDANGVPTGLEDSTVASNLQTLPARGVQVRAYQLTDQTLLDGSTTSVWLMVRAAATDTNGEYTLTIPQGKPTMVEVLSSFDGGGHIPINLIADPAGINSTVPVTDRVEYGLRKALDGSAPDGNPVPASLSSSNTTLNFSVGLTDKWWLVDPNYNTQTLVAPMTAQAVDETTLPGRTTGTGSRVLAIGDSIATFVSYYGYATPGAPVDLHYAPGVSEPRGSFIEYDASVYPLAITLNPGSGTFSRYFFGSLQGGANDDAWDEGVLFPLLARNVLYNTNLSESFGMPGAPLSPQATLLTHLSPDQALIEGFADAMAANLLKSPYLADTEDTGLAAPVVDVRDLSGLAAADLSPDSAPAIRALSWDLILKANSLPNPSTVTDWNNIDPSAMVRFFSLPTSYSTEPVSIFSQIARLEEAKAATDPVDLASIFTDTELTNLLAPFGIPWPRPATGPLASFAYSWGPDPNSTSIPLDPIIFSMADAVQVRGAYPNLSPGEVAYADFSLSADKAYTMTVSISPALASTAQLEMVMPTFQASPIYFTGSGGSQRMVLSGNNTTPLFHPVRLRLISPTVQQPDTTVTVSLVPAS